MFNQNIISNEFNLNWSTTFSYTMALARISFGLVCAWVWPFLVFTCRFIDSDLNESSQGLFAQDIARCQGYKTFFFVADEED